MPSSDKSIVNFEKTVGVKHYSEFKYFEKHIYKKYGRRKAEEIFEVIDARARGDLIDIYPLLHESLDLSIDFLSLQAGLHKRYLTWFLQQEFRHRDIILDVACGNGYLPCFYAKQFPQSEVLGIDSCQEAVACAKELAQRLNLQNVRFEVMDVTSFEKNLLPARIDLITAVTAFNDILNQPSVLYTPPYLNSTLPSRQFLQNWKDDAEVESLNDLSEMLPPTSGTFVSVERWTKLSSFGWWTAAIHNARLAVDYDKSSFITDRSLASGEPRRIPVLVATKAEERSALNIDDATAFWLRTAFLRDSGNLHPFSLKDDIAEAAFVSVNPKSFRYGIKAVLGDQIVRFEIWQAGPFLLIPQFDSQKFLLEVLPSTVFDDAVSHLQTLAEPLRQQANVSTYDKPEVDW